MKEPVFENPNKMTIKTGHKTFDRQTNIITTGNICANTMRGGYIRPSYETKCGGITRPPGHLQKFDLDGFSPRIPAHIEKQIKSLVDQHGGGILYCFYHWYTPREYYAYSRKVYREYPMTKYIHGWILTDKQHNHIETFYTSDKNASYEIMVTVKPYVCK